MQEGISMTLKEFYQWVEENNIEDYELCYNGDTERETRYEGRKE